MRILMISMCVWVLTACGAEEGTRGAMTGEICAEGNALAQCPPNTRGVLESEAATRCDSNGSIDLESASTATGASGSGAVSQVCTGSGACRVVCELIDACEFGIQSISEENGIQCLAAPCGNGICESGEDPMNCEQDCSAVCGNEQCEPGETPTECPADCGFACGDGVCEMGENPIMCPSDCTTDTACGDGMCDVGENPANCAQDCGAVCGNSDCEPGEDPMSCPQDCAAQTACGNGVCEARESVESCPADCTVRVCDPDSDSTRCFEGTLQQCNRQGEWDDTPCAEGQICSEESDGARCVDAVPCEALCTDLQSCIENSPICGDFDVESYTPLCLGRCEQYPGRFLDYAEDTVDCMRALDLNLIADARDAFLPFCAPEACLSSCDALWTRCVQPDATDTERQCGQVDVDAHMPRIAAEFFLTCGRQCQGQPRGYEIVLETIERGNTTGLCSLSYQNGLFECRPAECGNAVCEYGEGRAGCGMMNDCQSSP